MLKTVYFTAYLVPPSFQANLLEKAMNKTQEMPHIF